MRILTKHLSLLVLASAMSLAASTPAAHVDDFTGDPRVLVISDIVTSPMIRCR